MCVSIMDPPKHLYFHQMSGIYSRFNVLTEVNMSVLTWDASFYAFLTTLTRATCSAHFILLKLNILKISGDVCTL